MHVPAKSIYGRLHRCSDVEPTFPLQLVVGFDGFYHVERTQVHSVLIGAKQFSWSSLCEPLGHHTSIPTMHQQLGILHLLLAAMCADSK